jgi:RHS repeat-associated protein
LGSVRLEMVGSVVETATTYSPYGEVLEQAGASGTVYGFTGEQEDGATGLLYLRARYYNAALKVFQSRDPWEGTGWRPQTLNYYVYANNNPLLYTDPSGETPWDVIDIIFLALSAYQFQNNPTWGNAGWLALDVVCALPVLPSVGYLRYGDEAVQLYSRITRVVTEIGLEGGQQILRVIDRFDDGGQLALDFLKIGDMPGARKIIKDLATGAKYKVKGSRFELEYAVKHADDIVEIGRSLGSQREIDFVLKNGTFVDTKGWNLWADFYQKPKNLARKAKELLGQADVYLAHTDQVEFVFRGDQPIQLLEEVAKNLQELLGEKVVARVIELDDGIVLRVIRGK